MDLIDPDQLLIKHAPQRLRDFVGNIAQKSRMHTFIANESERSIIVIGPSGCGKTLLCELLFVEHDVRVIRPSYEVFTTQKELEAFIETSIRTRCITDMLNKRLRIIFFDDIEVLIANNRFALAFITNLVTRAEFPKDIKIIITCTTGEEKRLADLKKKVSDVVKMRIPSVKDSLAYTMNILDKEGFDVDAGALMDLIKSMQCNIRNVFLNITMCCDIDEEARQRAYGNMNVFETVAKIFATPHLGIADLEIAMLTSDPTLISYIMYDNFRGYIRTVCEGSEEQFTWGGRKVLEYYTASSTLDAYAFAKTDWLTVEWANIIKCASIRAFHASLPMKKGVSPIPPIKYTTILNRSTQHYCNLKKFVKYASQNDADIENMSMLCDVGSSCNWKVSSKLEEGSMMSAFALNIGNKKSRTRK